MPAWKARHSLAHLFVLLLLAALVLPVAGRSNAAFLRLKLAVDQPPGQERRQNLESAAADLQAYLSAGRAGAGSVRLGLGLALAALGQEAQAERQLAQSAEPGLAYLLAADWARRDAANAAALAWYARALASGGRVAGAHFASAEILSDAGQFAQAEVHYRLAVAAEPDNYYWHLRRAANARRAGRPEDAIAIYRQMTGLFPDFGPAYLELADVYRRMDKRQLAAEAGRQALALEHDWAPAQLLKLAQILEWAGERQAAVRAYEGLLAVEPGSAAAQEALGRLQSAP
ncbi:MAG: hypothetical protein ACRDHL_02070 [Candidatus Promineifilaceae bacterium]